MQRHEGPRRDPNSEERQRQRNLTRWLSLAILVLGGLVAAILFSRWW